LAGFVGDSFSFPLMQGGTAAFVIGYLLWVQPTIAMFAILLYLPQLVVVPLGQGCRAQELHPGRFSLIG
jgi:hypothetical protein